ncbi:unnamed protein product [Mycena citricolor]|uniref:Uncharacterized protein n=1 Tax=Mycena citricolor TaxID=2018698 RepID=A0AAD2Q4H9_9AGAR|nr:unnamed protein product [Mycena citricolor]
MIASDLGETVFDEHKTKMDPLFPATDSALDTLSSQGSWLAGWMCAFRKNIGTDYIPADLFLVDPCLFYEVYFCPNGWNGSGDSEYGAELGDVALRNSLEFVSACTPSMVSRGGYDNEQTQRWAREVVNEIKTRRIYVCWELAVSIKSLGS